MNGVEWCCLQGEDIVFLATDINLPGAVDWVMMQSCFGNHFMLVLEKQEKIEGPNMFYAVVQLIGSRKQAENFMYRCVYKVALAYCLFILHNVDSTRISLQTRTLNSPTPFVLGGDAAFNTRRCAERHPTVRLSCLRHEQRAVVCRERQSRHQRHYHDGVIVSAYTSSACFTKAQCNNPKAHCEVLSSPHVRIG